MIRLCVYDYIAWEGAMPRNDHPTSRRMGFGFEQARAAGLEGIRPDRSPRQVNKIIQESKETREAIRELQEVRADPEWKQLIEHRASQGHSAQEIAIELGWIKRYAWAKSKGYRLEWLLRHHWPYGPEFGRRR